MSNFTKTVVRIIGSLILGYVLVGLLFATLWLAGFEQRVVDLATKGGLQAAMIPLQFVLFLALGRFKPLTIHGPKGSI